MRDVKWGMLLEQSIQVPLKTFERHTFKSIKSIKSSTIEKHVFPKSQYSFGISLK